MDKSVYWYIYWTVFAILSPIVLILLFAWILKEYMIGITIISSGIMIWMGIIYKDSMRKHFYRTHGKDISFIINSRDDSELLDTFYGEAVYVYFDESWAEYEKFISALLKREKIHIDNPVNCYRISTDLLNRKYNYEYFNTLYIKYIILLPLSQFNTDEKSSLGKHLGLSSYRNYTTLINCKYGHKKSLTPTEYKYSAENIFLEPMYSADITNIAKIGSDIHICISNINQFSTTYFDCLLVIKNSEIITDGSTSGIEKIFLSSDIDAIYLSSISYSQDINTIELDFELRFESDYELFEDDCDFLESYILSCSFERIEWYWDASYDNKK